MEKDTAREAFEKFADTYDWINSIGEEDVAQAAFYAGLRAATEAAKAQCMPVIVAARDALYSATGYASEDALFAAEKAIAACEAIAAPLLEGRE